MFKLVDKLWYILKKKKKFINSFFIYIKNIIIM